MRSTRGHRRLLASCAAGVVLLACAAADAEVTALTGETNAIVTEFIDGESGSSDSSFERFPETSPTLPMESFAGRGNFTGETGENHGGRAIADLRDPTISASANPGELGLEVDLFSQDEQIAYTAVADALEVRTVLFAEGDLVIPSTGEPLVASSVFANGAIVIWSEDEERDLAGLSVDFEFVVTQERADIAPLVVFEAVLQVEGQADSEVRLVHSEILEVLLGGPELLADAGDPASAELVAELEAVGKVHVILIPDQQIDYLYTGVADEAFNLRAVVRLEAANLAGGTGVAAVHGRPFESLAAAIEPALASPKGAAIQDAVNRSIAAVDDEPGGTVGGGLCGVLGVEMGLVATLGLLRRRGGREANSSAVRTPAT